MFLYNIRRLYKIYFNNETVKISDVNYDFQLFEKILILMDKEAKKKNLKPEWQPGGSRRQELLDKAVEYLKAPIMETQADRHHFGGFFTFLV